MSLWNKRIIIFIFQIGIFVQVSGQTFVKGEIASDTVWTESGNPYILTGDIIVKENVKFTIEQGVIVKPLNSNIGMQVFGNLIIEGTLQKPVIFTSIKDDSFGGDSNGDGTITSPKSGDWGTVNLYFPGKNNLIKNAWFGYGGGNFSMGTIYNKSLSLKIDSCTFYSSAENAVNTTRSVTVENCNFVKNQATGIYLDLANASAEINLFNNTFSNNSEQAVETNLSGTVVKITSKGNVSSGSGLNGISAKTINVGNLIYNGDSLFPMIIKDGEVPLSTKLSLKEGSWVEFTDKASRLLVRGTIEAIGSETDPVVFTSIKENRPDSTKLDSLLQPAPGDWDRIVITNQNEVSVLRNVEFRHGGSSDAMVTLYNTKVEIDSCIFNGSKTSGLHVNFTKNVISYSTESKNGEVNDLVNENNTGLKVSNCRFFSNKTNGVLLEGNNFLGKIEFFKNQFFNNNYAVNSNITEISYDILLNNNTASGNFRNGFKIGGTVAGNVTLETNPAFSFILSKLTVDSTATLNLLPNTILKFEQAASGLEIKGNMVLKGTENNPVIFTSIKDDLHGGDTNGDGQSIPEPGDWDRIYLHHSSNGILLENCWFGYGNTIMVESDNVEIRNCTFEKFCNDAIYIKNSSPKIHHNRIIDSRRYGVRFHNSKTTGLYNNYFENHYLPVFLEYDTISSNITFENKANTFAGPGIRGVGLKAGISGEVTLIQNNSFPLIIYSLNVFESSKLIFPAGGIYKFVEGRITVLGMLDILGTEEKPVIFTSINDDSRLGDTNGDGNSTKPSPGDWEYIGFNSNFNSKISHLWMGYGGGNYNGIGMLYFSNSGRKNFGSTITVENCTITKSMSSGIYLNNDSQPEIRNCNIINNIENGILADHSQPVLTNNNIYGNGFYGVKNTTQQPFYNVDARNNYWGNSTGPFHHIKNPLGKGDYISDFVLFDPFLKEPANDWIIQNTNPNVLVGQIEIFPVPANQKITLSFDLKAETQLQVNLLNIEGKLIEIMFDKLLPAGQSKLSYSVENLNNGIYFAEFISDQTKQVRKFVVANM